jgi:glycosyltransferase involved in cell wall biosynthesis
MIRVLHVFGIMNRGGSETFIMNIYRKINREKIQFDFMVQYDTKGEYDDEILGLGGKIFRVKGFRQLGPINYEKQLYKFFTQHAEYQIVHSHMVEMSGIILKQAKKAGVVNRISHSHTQNPKYNILIKLYKTYAKFNINKSNVTHALACSQSAGDYLYSKTIFKNTYRVIKNSIDTEIFKYNKNSRLKLKKELNIQDKFVIGHVGRFAYAKNHDFIIEVFKEVYKENRNSILLLVGEGPLKTDIYEKVKKADLSQAVKFLGVRSDISELLSCMDVFLFPSHNEGFPVSLVEAQAAALHIIASDKITSETKLTNYIVYKSLEESSQKWADSILKHVDGYERIDTSPEIIDHGYDIVSNAKYLEDYYLSLE